jgi:hypothetical protein
MISLGSHGTGTTVLFFRDELEEFEGSGVARARW